ncbi:hypothetical protein EYR36_004916 [Pleurotus pulmonarius]|nr:hypothetical protein EYR36_004916 [Pleurotus pulmonarius]
MISTTGLKRLALQDWDTGLPSYLQPILFACSTTLEDLMIHLRSEGDLPTTTPVVPSLLVHLEALRRLELCEPPTSFTGTVDIECPNLENFTTSYGGVNHPWELPARVPESISELNLQGANIRKLDLVYIKEHAQGMLASTPIPYLKTAKVCGALFRDEDATAGLCTVCTSFFVDHDEPLAVLHAWQEYHDMPWVLGDLPEGNEYLCIIKNHASRLNDQVLCIPSSSAVASANVYLYLGCTAPTPSPPKNETCGAVTAAPTIAQPLGLEISKWIWTGENAVPGGPNPAGARAFRKTVTSQCGKCAVSAKILISADNSYKLFVNGNPIGAGSNFRDAEVYYVALQPSSNLFAVEVTNSEESPAALIASILVQYSDGSTETVITDETWRKFLGSPKGFELPSTTDLSKWGFATFQGLYGVAPWGKTEVPPALSVKDAVVIWTGKFDNKTGIAPTLARAFRKTVVTPGCKKRAVSATASIFVDNQFIFYVNGAVVGSFASWRQSRVYHIPVLDPDVNVFALNGKNTGGPAAFQGVIQILYDDGTSDRIVTDTTWKAQEKVTAGFESPKLDDSKWANATSMGRPITYIVPSA